jgi:plasmid stability protein
MPDIRITLTEGLHRALRVAAAAKGEPLTDYVPEILAEHLAKQPAPSLVPAAAPAQEEDWS